MTHKIVYDLIEHITLALTRAPAALIDFSFSIGVIRNILLVFIAVLDVDCLLWFPLLPFVISVHFSV